MDLTDIYRAFHLKATEYINTFFSSVHGTFSRIDHTLSQKSSLDKFKKIEITSNILPDQNTMRLEINYKKTKNKNKNTVENTNPWRLNNILLNNQWITGELKEEIKNIPRDK